MTTANDQHSVYDENHGENNEHHGANNEQYDPGIRQQAKDVVASGVSGLQFEAALEQRFISWYSYRYRAINRIYLLAGALAIAIFSIADQIITPGIIEELLTVRIAAVFFILLVFIASHWQFVIPYLPALLFLVAGAVHVCLLVTASYAAHSGHYYYQDGTFISVIFACLVLRLQFNYVLPLALLMWFSQILSMYFFMSQPFAEFIEVFVVYTVILLLALVVCFRTEYEIRRYFLMQILLTKQAYKAN